MKNLFTIAIFFFYSYTTFAQSVFVPLNKDIYHLIDRYEIKSGQFASQFYSSYKPYKRSAVIDLVDSLKKDSANFSKTDKFNLDYLTIDNWTSSNTEKHLSKRPILNTFYKTKSDFYSVNTKDLKLRVNPVMYLQGGKDNTFSGNLYTNTRGVVVEGTIDDKVSFYTFMADNQMNVPTYVDNYISKYTVLPGQGFLKPVKDANGIRIPNSTDFFTARGYVTFNATKHINVQFGHDRNFIGNGYRSLIFSDFAPNYFFLKLTTQIWKFQYTNLFTEMQAEAKGNGGDRVLGKKYVAFHHLGLNLTKWLNMGVFETVISGRPNGSVEIQYLNPIIFYRSVEQQVGSEDNAILGADFKANFLRHFSAYGQLVLDEFTISNVRARNGWWANKQAFQLGLKYIDAFGISNLDFQIERNYIRPYTYQHKDNFRNYSHYNQPIAHPMGANLKELILLARYQPLPRLELRGRILMTNFGIDTGSSNYGGNVLLDYTTYNTEFGNTTAQGINSRLQKIDFTASYQVKQNIFIDFTVTKRKQTFALSSMPTTNATILSGALRWNIRERRHDF